MDAGINHPSNFQQLSQGMEAYIGDGTWEHFVDDMFEDLDPDLFRSFLHEAPPDVYADYWRSDGEHLSQAVLSAYSYENIHSETFRRLLHQEGADIMNAHVLPRAMRRGNLDMIRNYGLFEAALCEQTYPPLIRACSNRNWVTVLLLLSTPGINVNDPCPRGTTALHEVCSMRDDATRILSFLVQHPGVNVNALDGEGKHPLLRLHLGCTPTDEIHPLLERADLLVNFQDNDQRTPLTHAVQHGNINLVRQLLNRPDIDIAIHDGNGQTAFALVEHEGLTSEEFMRVWGPEMLEKYSRFNQQYKRNKRTVETTSNTRAVEEQSTIPLVVTIALPLALIAAFIVTAHAVFNFVKKAK